MADLSTILSPFNNELVEWQERHVYHRLQDQQTREELQHCGSYGKNLIEKWISNPSHDKMVLEITEQIEELHKKWPVAWGKLDENSIGVVTPYAVCIRAELHKRKLQDVTVEQMLNIQGRHFRVLFLSTVRTRHTYKYPSAVVKRKDQQQEEPAKDLEYGFLSSSRMLSTVLPRAQSLLAVVGDPVALCTIGKCRKIWEQFISLCHERSNLHGVAMHEIHTQLDNLELSRSCVLNPLAPEFIPQTLLHPAFSRRLQASFPRLSDTAALWGLTAARFAPSRFLLDAPQKSASPLQRTEPQGRNNIMCVPPYRSCFVMPVPVPCSSYQNRLPLDPRIMACQAAVAYNINLLQNQDNLSPGPFISGSLSPHQTYQSSIGGSVEHSKTVNSAIRENVRSSDRCISKFSQWMEQCGDLVNEHPHHHCHYGVPQSLNMHSPLVQNHDVFRLSSQQDASHIDSFHRDPNFSLHERFLCSTWTMLVLQKGCMRNLQTSKQQKGDSRAQEQKQQRKTPTSDNQYNKF
ncbi:putative helicase with zinc finger domain [Acipenser ruthenus]|uniref:Putative helicase with zinc finger domain n=1 Tax=Acipenser ruthenus TaxID=7906 RepID=A0A444U9X5_ACIRT|nr:putative helicase with zinc finger domain [Acipenser ruthenus]